MPELPEVETVRRDLAEVLPGRQTVAVAVTGKRSVRRQLAVDFTAALERRQFEAVRRHGKFLIIDLDGGEDALVVHLRMSGQLRISTAREEVAKHTHVVISLDGNPNLELRFVDPRTFGEMFLDRVATPAGRPAALAVLGPDALDPLLTGALFHRRLTAGRRSLAVKAALLDQRVLAGVGNIYADEALFAAGIAPDRAAASITTSEASLLLRGTKRILRAAVVARGSSFRDAAYVDAYGRLGGYATRHMVYGRAGLPCLRCGTPIERRVVAARGTHACPVCQPSGHVHATVRDARRGAL